MYVEDQAMKPSIRFAGCELGEIPHVCAFFNGDDEKYRVLLPFIKDGFDCGDKSIHVVDMCQRRAHLQRLTSAGIDAEAALKSGRLELLNNTETYLRDGRFDQDRMLDLFERLAGAPRDGFRLSRIVCHMDWLAGRTSHMENVLEFEARVNDVWRRYDNPVICVYDLAKFGGGAVVDIMRTHPMVIIGGILQENPFFVPAAEFLCELRDRRAQPAATD
jgi:hypothetical protein